LELKRFKLKADMSAKKSTKKIGGNSKNSFARFLSDPLIATALIVFALIALVLSILEISKAIAL